MISTGEEEYSMRSIGITAAVIGLVIVPIILGMVCVGYRIFLKAREDDASVLDRNVRPVSEGRGQRKWSENDKNNQNELSDLRGRETEVQ